jgi:hypothetical protein
MCFEECDLRSTGKKRSTLGETQYRWMKLATRPINAACCLAGICLMILGLFGNASLSSSASDDGSYAALPEAAGGNKQMAARIQHLREELGQTYSVCSWTGMIVLVCTLALDIQLAKLNRTLKQSPPPETKKQP